MNKKSKSSKDELIIYEMHQYRDSTGRVITKHVPVKGEGKLTFAGHALANIRSPQGPIQQPMEFEISAVNLTEAFALFNDAAELEKKALLAQLQAMQQQIVTPDMVVPGGSLVQ